MSWHARRLAAFDIETTGVDCDTDRIVTAAVSVVGGGEPSEHRLWRVDPGVEIPAEATAVHGISTEQARREGSDPRGAVDEICGLLALQLRRGVPVIAFNARFDLTLLDREARRHGVTPLVDRVGGAEHLLVVDPYVLDKRLDRHRAGKRTLGAVCAHYRVSLLDAHAAGADALAAARVAWRMGQAFGELRELELAALHAHQVQWAAEQATSLREHLLAEGRDERVEGAWPLVPLAVGADRSEGRAPGRSLKAASGLVGGDREGEGDDRPAVGGGVGFDRPPVTVDDPLADRKTQTAAGRAIGGSGAALERFEDPPACGRVDADPVVLDEKRHMSPSRVASTRTRGGSSPANFTAFVRRF